MTRSYPRFFLLATATFLTLSFSAAKATENESTSPADSAKTARPNILFIFTDDHAPHTIPAYDEWLKSINPCPHIDQLAREGMRFENSFCTNSICGPSRAVILTGKHSHKNGFMSNGNQFNGDQQTFPKLLQAAGYQTAMYGKWHLNSAPQGFDDWMVLPGQGLYYNPDFETPNGIVRIEGYCTDVVTDLAADWLKEKRDPNKPFMLMCQHKAPHRNWMPAPRHLNLYDDVEIPEPATLFDDFTDNAFAARAAEVSIDEYMDLNFDLFLDLTPDFADANRTGNSLDKSSYHNMQRMSPEQIAVWRDAWAPKDEAFHAANLSGDDLVRWKFQRYAKNYLRCIKGVDESVARLRETLTQLGLAENTIVIYSSDQGFFIGDHGWYDKRWMYDKSLKMPLIVNWPGVTKPASVNEDLVQNIDYAETFLEIAGAAIPDDMQGRSLVPLLKGETPADWRDSIYYHYYEYPSTHMVPRHNGIRSQQFKLIHFYQFAEWEFYDLKHDPAELINQYDNPAYAEAIAEMKTGLENLQKASDDDSDLSEKPAAWQQRFRGAEK